MTFAAAAVLASLPHGLPLVLGVNVGGLGIC